MARVSKEVEKIIQLKKPKITLADVDELVYKDADYRIYEMTNAIPRKNYSLFTEICTDLLTKGYDENALLASILSYFKNALTVLSSDKTDAELAGMLKSKDWAIKKTREQAGAIGKDKLVKQVNYIYNLQSNIKNGNRSAQAALSCAIENIFFC
jgi:DNA polymerase III delta subunit